MSASPGPSSKRQSVEYSEVFDAPASRLWSLLVDWGGIVEWMPDGYIRSLRLEGKGTGAVRHLVTGQGVTISERLDEIDAHNGRLRLSIIEPLPWGMLSYSARARLKKIGPDQCELNWRGTFELPTGDASSGKLAALLEHSYARMFKGLRNELARPGAG